MWSFSDWIDIGYVLNPYATEFRYPGMTDQPDMAEYEEASEKAEKLFMFVLSKLPEEARPE